MEVILSKQCESLTGLLNRDLGYFIQRRGKRFFSQRSKYSVPPDGHWRFIVLCAQLAQSKLHIADIQVHWTELHSALYEARLFVAALKVHDNYNGIGKTTYDARDILNLKTTFSL
jgi:hypothetical protein